MPSVLVPTTPKSLPVGAIVPGRRGGRTFQCRFAFGVDYLCGMNAPSTLMPPPLVFLKSANAAGYPAEET